MLTACTAAKPEANMLKLGGGGGKNGDQKLSDTDINEFENLIVQMGRIEELTRNLNGGGTWGANDDGLKQIKTAIGTKCVPSIKTNGQSTRKGYISNVIELLGSTCPILFKINFEFQGTGSAMDMTGMFYINQLPLAQKNGIRSFEISNWSGKYARTSSYSEVRFSGTGKFLDVDGKAFTFSSNLAHRVEQRAEGIVQSGSGETTLKTPTKTFVLHMYGPNSFALNDRAINQETYFGYLAKMGLFADGLKALEDF